MTGPLVAIGRVRAPHGRDGALVVRPLTDVDGNFREDMNVFLAGSRPAWMRLERILNRGPRGLVVCLEGITTREKALDLKGYVVQVPREGLARPAEGTYYVFDLVGLEVRLPDGQVLGVVADVLPGPGNDVLAIRGESAREILLPMIRDVVRSVNREHGVIIVEPWEGMVE